MIKKMYKRKTCPKCGSIDFSTYMYGLPDDKVKPNPKIIWRGCCIGNNDPKYICNGCKTEFYSDMTEWHEVEEPVVIRKEPDIKSPVIRGIVSRLDIIIYLILLFIGLLYQLKSH